MNWKTLQSENDLNALIEKSFNNPQVIFKHSTTCPISQISKTRFEIDPTMDKIADVHYLDILNYREVSNLISETFGIVHQSPQVLIISKNKSIYNSSHLDIQSGKILELLKKV